MTQNIFNKRQFFSWLIGLYIALSSLSAVNVTIRYPVELGKLSLDDLQCLRIATIQSNDQKVLAQRAELVARAQQLFSIESIMSKLCTQPPDNVIIWLTNYYGNISTKTLDWYSKNVFAAIAPLPNTCLWGTNLDKWLLFANTTENIKKFYETADPDIAAQLANMSETPFKEQCCPLTKYSDSIAREVIENKENTCPRFCTLQSTGFFRWLYTLPPQVCVVIDNLSKALCRPRPATIIDRFSCSLRQLGYMPPCLSKVNVLDLDIYSLLPLLQYLEAIYYVENIITRTGRGGSMCFLFNLREIIFYLFPGESRPFEIFEQHMQYILSATLPPDLQNVEVIVDMAPFLYNDLVKAPYKDGWQEVTREEFESCIKFFFGTTVPNVTPKLQAKKLTPEELKLAKQNTSGAIRARLARLAREANKPQQQKDTNDVPQ